jgi:hypothetical protein
MIPVVKMAVGIERGFVLNRAFGQSVRVEKDDLAPRVFIVSIVVIAFTNLDDLAISDGVRIGITISGDNNVYSYCIGIK